MIFGGNIESLIDFFSFTVWIFYGMSMLALLVLRKSKPDIARPYKVSTIPTVKPNRHDLGFGPFWVIKRFCHRLKISCMYA